MSGKGWGKTTFFLQKMPAKSAMFLWKNSQSAAKREQKGRILTPYTNRKREQIGAQAKCSLFLFLYLVIFFAHAKSDISPYGK
ncbi:MAG: hypothetical protein E7655_00440 [Ruminococcaceae bacterium]|nr:hypothetical protein [Oscillospiraceae bacterium]